jgi:hypothetical protein
VTVDDDERADVRAAIADPRVAAALERMAVAAGVDLDSTPEVFDDVFRRLRSVLADPEQGS